MDRQKLAELREKRAQAYDRMNDVLAEAGQNELTPEQSRRFDSAEADFDRHDEPIRRAERGLAADRGGIHAGRLEVRDRSTNAATGTGYGVVNGGRRATTDGPFLGRGASMVDWVEQRGLGQRDERTGLEPDEQREFNLGRLVRGAVTGNWTDSELENRALTSGGGSGQILVPTITSAGVIDLLRNSARLFEAGAQAVGMESETKKLPRITADPSPAWRAQSSPVAVSDPSFDGVTLKSRTLAVLTKISMELLEDVSPESSAAIEASLVAALALEIDRAGLYGSGTGEEPTGIKNTAGVNVAPIATNGAVPTNYAELVQAYFAVRKRNAQPSAFILSEREAETYAGLTASDGQPLRLPPAIEAVPMLSTNQIRTDQAEGTGTNAGDVYTGDFSKVAVGFRPEVGIRLASSRDTFLDSLEVAVVAFVRCDVAVLQPAALEVQTGYQGV